MTTYDCIIIGGGIAGLQAAIQLGRYKHNIAVIDAADGRSSICRCYHNILGWPNGVSGSTLRELGQKHAKDYGVHFIDEEIVGVKKSDNLFYLTGKSDSSFITNKILLATGIRDHIPPIQHIQQCLGLTVYVCPDCDGYEVMNKRVIVMGSGKIGANLAITLTYWTDNIVYINHDKEALDDQLQTKLQEYQIEYVQSEVNEVLSEEDGREFLGVRLSDGNLISGERGFIAFGGNKVRTDLAKQIGLERLENAHVVVDPRTKESNVHNVWAAGDIAVHSEQVTIAMGDGMQAAIWIHKRILEEGLGQ